MYEIWEDLINSRSLKGFPATGRSLGQSEREQIATFHQLRDSTMEGICDKNERAIIIVIIASFHYNPQRETDEVPIEDFYCEFRESNVYDFSKIETAENYKYDWNSIYDHLKTCTSLQDAVKWCKSTNLLKEI